MSHYESYGRTLYTAASGASADGSISINIVNLQFVTDIGTNNVGGFGSAMVENILSISIGGFVGAIERLADMRAENGAEQNRVMNSIELLQSNLTNLEAAHGRIMDADIACRVNSFRETECARTSRCCNDSTSQSVDQCCTSTSWIRTKSSPFLIFSARQLIRRAEEKEKNF